VSPGKEVSFSFSAPAANTEYTQEELLCIEKLDDLVGDDIGIEQTEFMPTQIFSFIDLSKPDRTLIPPSGEVVIVPAVVTLPPGET
jgi:hypothetical protein